MSRCERAGFDAIAGALMPLINRYLLSKASLEEGSHGKASWDCTSAPLICTFLRLSEPRVGDGHALQRSLPDGASASSRPAARRMQG